MTCIDMLEQWFDNLPSQKTSKMYKDILPLLSDFLNVYEEQKAEYYHEKVLKKETEFGKPIVSRRQISRRVLTLLGKLGGFAHSIIDNRETRDKSNYLRWDAEKRLKFNLPMDNLQITIYLDSCLPRVVDLA